jgi:hypothetical protein
MSTDTLTSIGPCSQAASNGAALIISRYLCDVL